MRRLHVSFWTLCIVLVALWLVADPVFAARTFSALQFPLINLTGILTMGMMSVSLLLALRSVRLEPYVGGLDKSYRLHKWLGVGALFTAIAHWLLIYAPGWLVSLGLMAQPARGKTPPKPPLHGIAAALHDLQGPAKLIGQWCFYAAVILIILALLRWFPYRWFLKTHRLLSIVFLLLVFHSVVLLKTAYWTHSIAYVLASLMLAGAAAAVYTLFRKVGRTRQAVGEILEVTSHQDGRILGVEVCLKDRWAPHQPGQFAFVSFEDREGPHPFTISSHWKDDGRLTFLIKGLGDYTRGLPEKLKKGHLVTVEGPYGHFNFAGKHPRQIWISGGIGITPFVARLQHLAASPDDKVIDHFHATAVRDDVTLAPLAALEEAAHVNLHVWVAADGAILTAAAVMERVPEWRSADVWFCGPVEFGKTLRHDFLAAGLSRSSFHQEMFHLR